jgi:hypothetical protein
MPQRAQQAIALRRQKLFLDIDGEMIRLRLGSWVENQGVMVIPLDAVDDAIGKLPRDAQQTILLMPGDKVLTRPLTLPLAAEENLREVLAFEMDQHTPFMSDDVYYDYLVTSCTRRRKKSTRCSIRWIAMASRPTASRHAAGTGTTCAASTWYRKKGAAIAS